MHRRWFLVAVVAALCGVLSLGAVATAGEAALSEKEWRKAAGSICRKANLLSDDVQQEVLGDLAPDAQPSLAQITAYVAGIEPIVDRLVDRIDALHEPKKLEQKVKRFVKTARRELDRLVADPSIGLEGNPFSDTSLRAAALGVKSCS